MTVLPWRAWCDRSIPDAHGPEPPGDDGAGAAMAERYDAYCSETVQGFLSDTFGRFGRQLVLVDVLGASPARTAARSSEAISFSWRDPPGITKSGRLTKVVVAGADRSLERKFR